MRHLLLLILFITTPLICDANASFHSSQSLHYSDHLRSLSFESRKPGALVQAHLIPYLTKALPRTATYVMLENHHGIIRLGFNAWDPYFEGTHLPGKQFYPPTLSLVQNMDAEGEYILISRAPLAGYLATSLKCF